MPIRELNKDKRLHAAVIYPVVTSQPVLLSPEARLEEAEGLARAINLEVVIKETAKLREIKPATYLSRGFLEKLKSELSSAEVELVIVDATISPIQQRNLEKFLNCKVIDRTALILEIFGERAQTKEGCLQVELAHLTYQRSRLVRSWTHLERQRGGAGFLGGPGETQIELDRRIIDDKIIRIKKDLEKVKKTRDLQRSARNRVPYPIVALVGYTNAGKSTLFNQLSKADVFAKDLLFATLDPTMRKIATPSGQDIIISDTVGFISDLPHELIMSFRATLEEVLSADIVVHVRDIVNENSKAQCRDVIDVLHSLGLKTIENEPQYIEVWNKTDLLDEASRKALTETASQSTKIAPVSAVSGEGIERLLSLIEDKLSLKHQIIAVKVAADEGKLISWIHDHAHVLETRLCNNHMFFKLKMDVADKERLLAKAGIITLD